MKKVLLIIMMIGIVGFGCVPTAAPATPATNPVQELQTWRTGMDTWKVTVADPAIAKINAQVAGANYQPQIDALKTTLTAKDTVITDLTTRLTALENWKTTMGTQPTQQPIGQPGQGTTPQFTQGTTPGVITPSPTGTVVSQVNVVSGNLQIASSTTASSQPVWYVQRIINYNTAIQYVRPKISLSQSNNYGYNSVPTKVTGINIALNSIQCTMNIAGVWASPAVTKSIIPDELTTTLQAMSITPGMGYPTTSFDVYPLKGCGTPSGELYLSPGGYLDITVQISGLLTTESVFWTVVPSLSYHP